MIPSQSIHCSSSSENRPPQVNFTHLDLQNILKLGRIQLGEEPWSVDPIPLVKVMQEERAYPLSALPSNQQAQIKELCELVKVPTTLAAQSLQAAISLSLIHISEPTRPY